MSETEMDVFLRNLETHWGGLYAVCANACTGGPAGEIDIPDYDERRRCIAINVHESFLSYGWIARAMKAQNSVPVAMTSSTAGFKGHSLRSPYSATKWAAIGMAKTRAMELGLHGIPSTCFAANRCLLSV